MDILLIPYAELEQTHSIRDPGLMVSENITAQNGASQIYTIYNLHNYYVHVMLVADTIRARDDNHF